MSAPQDAQLSLDAVLDQILEELDEGYETLPVDAIVHARDRREAIVPKLIEAIRQATAEARAGDCVEGNAQVFAILLLAEFGAKESFPAIAESVALPGELPEEIYGDVLYEYLGNVLAALVDDDLSPIDRLIQDCSVNQFVRWEAIRSYGFLLAEGRIDRAEMMRRLGGHLRHGIDDRDSDLVTGVMLELYDFAPRELFDLIQEAFDQGLVDEIIPLKAIEDSIAEGDAGVQEELERRRQSKISDAIQALEGWYDVGESSLHEDPPEEQFRDDDEEWASADLPGPTDTIVNTEPRIGRNDPCPCGSGKKYKKCCGAV